MNEQVIVIGASGHGKVVADIILRCGDTLLGFLDDNETLPDKMAWDSCFREDIELWKVFECRVCDCNRQFGYPRENCTTA